MANAPKKIKRPWAKEYKPFERDRTAEFDYNGRRWRDLRELFFSNPVNALCIDCVAQDKTTAATVADHEPQAKVLMSQGLDPYDIKYLKPRCRTCHNKKSGRERHS